jgi:hypothetical protein
MAYLTGTNEDFIRDNGGTLDNLLLSRYFQVICYHIIHFYFYLY